MMMRMMMNGSDNNNSNNSGCGGRKDNEQSDLEAFSYSVSHDLKAPLRAIEGFSAMLLEDYGDRLDNVGRSYIERVRANVTHMSALIEDILDFSRATHAELRRMPVDIGDLARRAIEDLKARDPDRKVKITIGHGLFAKADGRLVRIVVENLLANAWKFTSKTENAEITIGKETVLPDEALAASSLLPNENGFVEPDVVFFVRDNGVGFDLKDANARRLFTPFSRLHEDGDFEGTGVGLATVKRIVERHGGRIWAESAPQKGATFKLTLV